jgi:hypothetical protein
MHHLVEGGLHARWLRTSRRLRWLLGYGVNSRAEVENGGIRADETSWQEKFSSITGEMTATLKH